MSQLILQKCSTCHENKEFNNFPKLKSSKNGYHHQCKACQKTYRYKLKEQNQSSNWQRPELKKCATCKEFIKGTYFSKGCHNKDGLQPYCKYHATLTTSSKEMFLTRDQFFKLIDEPCYYCGSEENVGVDRVDNLKNYQVDNCVSCCWVCNRMKNAMDGDKFLNAVDKIANHRIKILETSFMEDFDDIYN